MKKWMPDGFSGVMENRSVIGGEFELSAPVCLGDRNVLGSLTRGDEGTWTSSGRSAFVLILSRLKSMGVNHVHLPAYLCESLLLTVKAMGMGISFYPVDVNLNAKPDPPFGSAVLLVHYFGLINASTKRLRRDSVGSYFLVEDYSQAIFSYTRSIPEGVFAFFSARKFGPVLLGGWCNISKSEEQAPTTGLELLAWKSLAGRLLRGSYLGRSDALIDSSIEEFYLAVFDDVESYLNSYPCESGMPEFAMDFISGLDWNRIAQCRQHNWNYLNTLLQGIMEPVVYELPDGVVPLTYVVRLPKTFRDKIRKLLADNRIFAPVYWPLPTDVDSAIFSDAFELSASLLSLPIDQRYGDTQMDKMSFVLKGIQKQ